MSKKILIIVNQKHSLCITLLSATMVQAWVYVSLSLVVISTVRGSMVCQHRDDIEHVRRYRDACTFMCIGIDNKIVSTYML